MCGAYRYAAFGGGVSVIYPAPDFADQIDAVAAKDVPQGVPYRIIETAMLPAFEVRARWQWTEAGPLAVAPDVPTVPAEVSRFQAKAALADAGLLSQADAIVAASGNVILQLAWAEATTFKRNSPGIAALAPALGLDEAALDDLFITAAGIVA